MTETRSLRLVLGDQLTPALASIRGLHRDYDIVLMLEVQDETTYVRHHKQKIAFVLSAMRHFAQELREFGIPVDYVKLDDPSNTGSLTNEVKRAVARHQAQSLILTEPGEWRVQSMFQDWLETFDIPVTILADDRFFCSRDEFAAWARGRRSIRMEYFYREMRRKTGYLMQGDQPIGGKWNFDRQNRKRLPRGENVPGRQRFVPDAVAQSVIDLVERRFGNHFGDLQSFGWAVSRAEARLALDDFVDHRLPKFGDYQDAMKAGEDFLYHSMLSPYLNTGLLTAREVCDRAVEEYAAGRAPLNTVEGFIRQIIGWREFVRGLYWLRMPDYADLNFLKASRKLPAFFWTGETDMNCLSECVDATRRNAYAHHIQRLMVTGNFALLAGIDPRYVNDWYMVVYCDAFEWVELPNVNGMILFADGGLLASKPYAASGAYIDRMSDYCAGCHYDPELKEGSQACPFNYLYWNFLIENEHELAKNPRLAMPYRTLARMTDKRRASIRRHSQDFLDCLATD